MSPSEPPRPPGWAGEIQGLYETFVLRDFVGYVFPGGVFLVGAIWTLGGTPWRWQFDGRLPTWFLVLLLISASYACGMFLRLLGAVTPLQLLVIAAARPGLWGDPWRRQVPATDDEAKVLEIYRRRLTNDNGARLESLIGRESVFLHLAGNLSLALVLLAVLVPVGFCSPIGSPMSGKEAVWAAVVLAVAGVILNVGHYEHARAIRLLLEAATPPR